MAGPLVLASALSRIIKIKCPWCGHVKSVTRAPKAFRRCPKCHKQFADPLAKRK